RPSQPVVADPGFRRLRPPREPRRRRRGAPVPVPLPAGAPAGSLPAEAGDSPTAAGGQSAAGAAGGVGLGIAGCDVAGSPVAVEAPVVVSSDIATFSHDTRASTAHGRESASSGSSRAPSRSIHWWVRTTRPSVSPTSPVAAIAVRTSPGRALRASVV